MTGGLVYGCIAPHAPVLVPAVGGRRAEEVRRSQDAMRLVASDIQRLSPDALVIVSPHAPLNPRFMSLIVSDSYSGGFDAFGAPSVRLSATCDLNLASAIELECRRLDVPIVRTDWNRGSYELDHGAAVPLYFIQSGGVRCPLVLLSFSALDVGTHRRFGRAIAAAASAADERVVLVASGDMSHRLFPGAPAGFSPRGREFDEAMVSALSRQDTEAILSFDEDLLFEAGECGYRSVVIAIGALPAAKVEVLSYEGPFGVGYLVARFLVGGVEPGKARVEGEAEATPAVRPPDETEALRLARLAVESYVRDGKMIPVPSEAHGLLAERAGVFVSLKKAGELRGCIGTFAPREPNVAAEIVRNAVAAAVRDPRFPPVRPDELPYLVYSVDILSKPEPVESPSQLDPKRYGVIVQAGSRRGLLLPDLEGVSTVDDQLQIARRKAGIPPGVPVQLYRFTVRRIKERD